MKGYITNIERAARDNECFRKVLYTSTQSQLVLMTLEAGEEIGEEVHDVDQFLRVEAGTGTVYLNGIPYELEDGSAVIVPIGTRHNVVNTGDLPLKLYSLYTPPHHRDGTVHKTKAEADADDEHFEGTTSELGPSLL